MRVAGIETRSASRRGCPAPGYTPPVTGSAGSCPLCGSTGGPVLMEEGRYVGRSCPCGTIYIDPDPDESGVDPTVDAHLADRHPALTALPAPDGPWDEVGRGARLLPQAAGTDGMYLLHLQLRTDAPDA